MKNLSLLVLFWLTLTTATAQISLVKTYDLCCQVGPFDAVNNVAVFNANGGLWRSDGSTAGTFQLTASASFDNYSFRRCRVGNVIYFW